MTFVRSFVFTKSYEFAAAAPAAAAVVEAAQAAAAQAAAEEEQQQLRQQQCWQQQQQLAAAAAPAAVALAAVALAEAAHWVRGVSSSDARYAEYTFFGSTNHFRRVSNSNQQDSTPRGIEILINNGVARNEH